MSAAADEEEFASYVVDLMQSMGPVRAKKMFGGYGIFLDGLMFALIADGTLYLKADKESESEFKSMGLDVFTYKKKGRDTSLSYYMAPEDTLEDPDQMTAWANKAYGAALRAASGKRTRGSRSV